MHSDLLIIGGGIIGLSTAYKYQLQNPQAEVLVLEKEPELSLHQTGRNSGVIHSGIYYKPGSLKALNCVNGYAQLLDFVRAQGVAHEVCGKIIVATNAEEALRLPGILERGKANGLAGLRLIDAQEIQEIEPAVRGVQGIWVPQTGIVDYPGMVRKMAECIRQIQPKSRVLCGQMVRSIKQTSGAVRVRTQGQEFQAAQAIVCGGLQADRLARMDGLQPDLQIVPFRGDYYDLTPAAATKVRNLIYPVPDPAFPFLGVHFTRMVHGGVECGPNAVFSFKREGYTRTAFSMRDAGEALSYPGTWRLFGKHWRHGLGEYQRAFSKRRFLTALQSLIPDLEMHDIVPARSGVRAQALNPQGGLIDDFVIVRNGHCVHVLNAPSPAATACLAIADTILAV